MPLHLESLALTDRLDGYGSVLFVSCPVCPPTSLAADSNSPLIDFLRHGIKTPAYEGHLDKLRESLESRGIRTGVFTSYLPCPTTCMWSAGQRRRLLKRARDYDAALVMGCESAVGTVSETLAGTACDVVPGMRLVGLTNAKLKFRFPMTVMLDEAKQVDAKECSARTTTDFAPGPSGRPAIG